MQIYFIKSGYNSYGGTFKEPFRYFGRIKKAHFKKEIINYRSRE